MERPSNLVIVNDEDELEDFVGNRRTAVSEPKLPDPSEFSFKSVLEHVILTTDQVQLDIDSILETLSEAVETEFDSLANRQRDLAYQMANIETLANRTLADTNSKISSANSVIRSLSTKCDSLANESEKSFDLLSNVIAQIQSIESHLPERERLSSLFSDNAGQYPRLHKLLLSTKKMKPADNRLPGRVFSFPVNGSSAPSKALPISSTHGPRRALSYSSLRDPIDFTPAIIRRNPVDFPVPTLTLKSVEPNQSHGESSVYHMPIAEADSASTISQVTTKSASFSYRNLRNLGRVSNAAELRTRENQQENPPSAEALLKRLMKM